MNLIKKIVQKNIERYRHKAARKYMASWEKAFPTITRTLHSIKGYYRDKSGLMITCGVGYYNGTHYKKAVVVFKCIMYYLLGMLVGSAGTLIVLGLIYG